MYIPAHYKGQNIKEAIAFIKKYSFATLITSHNNNSIATHLPFVISQQSNKLVLISHLARANPQSKYINGTNVLVIFSGPQAYISPKYYNSNQQVPTWNYIAVHTYGTASVVSTQKETNSILNQMINSYEPGYLSQWESLSSKYKSKMADAIHAFEITVNDLHFKEKLSQNKSNKERKRIIEHLYESESKPTREIAEYMIKTMPSE